jgi:hypothetical protein
VDIDQVFSSDDLTVVQESTHTGQMEEKVAVNA